MSNYSSVAFRSKSATSVDLSNGGILRCPPPLRVASTLPGCVFHRLFRRSAAGARDWYCIAEQPAPAPHLSHPEGCAVAGATKGSISAAERAALLLVSPASLACLPYFDHINAAATFDFPGVEQVSGPHYNLTGQGLARRLMFRCLDYDPSHPWVERESSLLTTYCSESTISS